MTYEESQTSTDPIFSGSLGSEYSDNITAAFILKAAVIMILIIILNSRNTIYLIR